MTLQTPKLRRRTPLLAGLLTAALTLAACGTAADTDSRTDTDGSRNSAASGESLLPAAEGAVEYPLTLETPWGETVLEERPERVAAVSPTARDVELLALLGVTPVVAPQPVERAVWTLDALDEEIDVIYEADHSGVTPLEVVAAQQPDVIVVFGKDLTDEFADLSAIAPIVSIDQSAQVSGNQRGADWEAELTTIGRALDLSAAAERVIDDYYGFFETVRAENPQFSGTSANYLVYYPSSGLEFFSYADSDPDLFLRRLGFEPSPATEQYVGDQNVSGELFSTIDADLIVIGSNADQTALEEAVTGTDLFQNLQAAQDGHVVVLETSADGTGFSYQGQEREANLAWALGRGGPLAHQWAAEQLIPVLNDVLG